MLFTSLSGVSGRVRFEDAILACLTSEGAPLEFKDSDALLTTMAGGKFSSFAGVQSSNNFLTVKGWISSGSRLREVMVGASSGGFIDKVKARLALYCVEPAVAPAKGNLYGAAAYKRKFEKLEEKAAKAPIAFEDCRDVNVHKWLATPDMQVQVKAWTDSAVVSGVVVEAEAKAVAPKHGKALDKTAAKKTVVDSYFT